MSRSPPCPPRALAALSAPALVGRLTLVEAHGAEAHAPWDGAVAIPARDEAGALPGCLAALGTALGAVRARIGVVVAVNNSRDASAVVARRALAREGLPHLVLDLALHGRAAHVGTARRAGLDVARRLVRDGGVLATTDADARVHPDWMRATLAEIGAGAEMVCGRVEWEDTSLFARFRGGAAEEGAYKRACLALADRLDPDPLNPLPHHGTPAGASLAATCGCYDAIGGMPRLPLAEDRAFAARALRHDRAVRYSPHVRVTASCRLDGRAAGGMADAIRTRLSDPDPLCDELLEPAVTLHRRASLRGRLRRAWAEPEARAAVLHAEGLGEPGACGFGAGWARIEARHPALARRRLRASELAAQLAEARALLEAP